MKDILQPFRAEVKKMLLTGYDEKRIMRMFRKEGIEEGRKAGIAEGIEKGFEKGIEKGRNVGIAEGAEKERSLLIISMFQNGLSAEKISAITKLSVQEIEDIKSAYE